MYLSLIHIAQEQRDLWCTSPSGAVSYTHRSRAAGSVVYISFGSCLLYTSLKSSGICGVHLLRELSLIHIAQEQRDLWCTSPSGAVSYTHRSRAAGSVVYISFGSCLLYTSLKSSGICGVHLLRELSLIHIAQEQRDLWCTSPSGAVSYTHRSRAAGSVVYISFGSCLLYTSLKSSGICGVHLLRELSLIHIAQEQRDLWCTSPSGAVSYTHRSRAAGSVVYISFGSCLLYTSLKSSGICGVHLLRELSLIHIAQEQRDLWCTSPSGAVSYTHRSRAAGSVVYISFGSCLLYTSLKSSGICGVHLLRELSLIHIAQEQRDLWCTSPSGAVSYTHRSRAAGSVVYISFGSCLLYTSLKSSGICGVHLLRELSLIHIAQEQRDLWCTSPSGAVSYTHRSRAAGSVVYISFGSCLLYTSLKSSGICGVHLLRELSLIHIAQEQRDLWCTSPSGAVSYTHRSRAAGSVVYISFGSCLLYTSLKSSGICGVHLLRELSLIHIAQEQRDLWCTSPSGAVSYTHRSRAAGSVVYISFGSCLLYTSLKSSGICGVHLLRELSLIHIAQEQRDLWCTSPSGAVSYTHRSRAAGSVVYISFGSCLLYTSLKSSGICGVHLLRELSLIHIAQEQRDLWCTSPSGAVSYTHRSRAAGSVVYISFGSCLLYTSLKSSGICGVHLLRELSLIHIAQEQRDLWCTSPSGAVSYTHRSRAAGSVVYISFGSCLLYTSLKSSGICGVHLLRELSLIHIAQEQRDLWCTSPSGAVSYTHRSRAAGSVVYISFGSCLLYTSLKSSGICGIAKPIWLITILVRLSRVLGDDNIGVFDADSLRLRCHIALSSESEGNLTVGQ
ncbi:hypothetical protein DEO72_LG9g3533 [Vigna unguiculata]|uniref:Uncharacterized protein n=1 Tax=Vigna unguiculata TaxID=3917 RepID=A0A4D6N6M6_VIGUN|nr:hypothetical protein DEO72_LG9g3533 [Vigna unguiculata]